jgi:hypothetical protein
VDVVRKSLVAITVAGLGVDACVHWTLAGGYDSLRATVSQGQLFRFEAGSLSWQPYSWFCVRGG